MSITKTQPLPEVRAARVHLRRDLCPIVDCPCGSTVQLTYHDPRGNGRMLHDLCPSCGSDVYLDALHYRDAYHAAIVRAVAVDKPERAAVMAREAVHFARKNRASLTAIFIRGAVEYRS